MGRPPITDWTAAPLGDVPDADLAAALGCSPDTVRRQRERRGIVMHGRVDWPRVADLGVAHDATIARRLGVHVCTVLAARRRAGLPPVRCLGHRGIDWDAQPLGRETDDTIAQRLGVDQSAVGAARRRRGIPRLPPREVDWDAVADLGRTWDETIARREGVIPGAVTAARKRRGIPKYREPRVCPCGRAFGAIRDGHRYCSLACASAASDGRTRHGIKDDTLLDAHVALVALRREVAHRQGRARA